MNDPTLAYFAGLLFFIGLVAVGAWAIAEVRDSRIAHMISAKAHYDAVRRIREQRRRDAMLLGLVCPKCHYCQKAATQYRYPYYADGRAEKAVYKCDDHLALKGEWKDLPGAEVIRDVRLFLAAEGE